MDHIMSYHHNGCYNMTQKSIVSKNIDIVYVKGNSYRIHFWYMSKHKRKRKRKAINLMTNSNLINKKRYFINAKGQASQH